MVDFYLNFEEKKLLFYSSFLYNFEKCLQIKTFYTNINTYVSIFTN